MNSLAILNSKRDEVVSLCKEYAVKRLQPCGPTARGEFDAWLADFQFIAEFDPGLSAMHASDPYFQFREKLGELLGGTVDLFDPTSGIGMHRFLTRKMDQKSSDWYAS